MDIICDRIEEWQDTSHQLSAWICKAKENSSLYPDNSWVWPNSPAFPPSYSNDLSSTRNSTKGSDSEDEYLFSEPPTPPGHIARSFRTEVENSIRKRTRDFSPVDGRRDGDDANKKQLVLWKPSLAQLIDLHYPLEFGTVKSFEKDSSFSNASTLRSHSTMDPRIQSSLKTPPPTPTATSYYEAYTTKNKAFSKLGPLFKTKNRD